MNSGLPEPMAATMPYISDAQRRWAHTPAARKVKFPTAEFDKESKGKKLPEKIGKRRMKVSYPSPKRPK
jgi:hypothetical protein